MKPPIIKGPPRIFKSSDEEEAPPRGPTVASLSTKIVTLHQDVRKLRDNLAESRVKVRDLEHDIKTLHFGLGRKIARVARAAGVAGALNQEV